MAKKIVMAIGAIFVLIGILGFIPAVAPDDRLFGIFEVSAAHNIVHLLSGAVALLAAANGEVSARLYGKVFGAVYALVTILGFIQGEGANVLGFIPVNQADNVLHLAIAATLLSVGFSGENSRSAQAGA